MSSQQVRLSSGGAPPERTPSISRSQSRDDALVPDTPSRSPAGPAAGSTLARTYPGSWQSEARHMRHPYISRRPAGASAPPTLPLLVLLAQRRIHVEKAESVLAFNRASHLISIRARSGQLHRLGLRLQELAQTGQTTPGCLRYELRQADGDAGPWSLHSEWSDEAAMQACLSSSTQRVFAKTLW